MTATNMCSNFGCFRCRFRCRSQHGISSFTLFEGSFNTSIIPFLVVASVVTVYLMSVVPERSWYSRHAYFLYSMSATNMEAEAPTSQVHLKAHYWCWNNSVTNVRAHLCETVSHSLTTYQQETSFCRHQSGALPTQVIRLMTNMGYASIFIHTYFNFQTHFLHPMWSEEEFFYWWRWLGI